MSKPTILSTIEKKAVLDASDILLLLGECMGEEELKLPDYVNFELYREARVLSVFMKMYVLPTGALKYPCTSGMQEDESCFEGWIVVLKHHLSSYIDTVVLQWDVPSSGDLNRMTFANYQRFLYRVFHFDEMFSWFSIGRPNLKGMELFYAEHVGLVNYQSGYSVKDADGNLLALKTKFGLSVMGGQLSIDIQKGKKPFFPPQEKTIDRWGMDAENRPHLFQICSESDKVEMITELLFCCEVMYDILISGRIGKLIAADASEEEKALYEADAIEGIRACFLFDDFSPLVKGVSSLLNTNRYGVEFLNVQYQSKDDLAVADGDSRLELKGGVRLWEEYLQSLYREKALLPGSGCSVVEGKDNLDKGMPEAISYFEENRIAWENAEGVSWRIPSVDMLSSQMQCVNCLFPLQSDKKAVLQLARLFDRSIDDVSLSLLPSYGESYIDFGFVFHNDRLLNERLHNTIRGGFWTSADACIMARRGEKKVLILIEWKYAESYCDSSDCVVSKTMQYRDNRLIKQSKQLIDFPASTPVCYFYAPFYELMRQTLLAEGIVRERVADDFLHILVAPAANRDLLESSFPFSSDSLETTWKCCLTEPDKFKVVDCRQILEEVIAPCRPQTTWYLKERYRGVM